MRDVYYGDRRVDAAFLRELADEDPDQLAAMLGINHAVRRHVGDIAFGIDRVLAGRLGVPAEGRTIDECGLFSSADELKESLADAVYADAARIASWLCSGRDDYYDIDVNPAGTRPSSDSPLSFPSVHVDDGTNALSVREVHGIHVSLARNVERPLRLCSITCYPCPTRADREAGRFLDLGDRLHEEIARTEAYASARSDSQRLALLATADVTDKCSVGYDTRRDRATVTVNGSATAYSMDATPKGLRVVYVSPEGVRRVWDDDDLDVPDEYNMSLMNLFYEDRIGYRTATAMMADAASIGYPMARMPGHKRQRTCEEPERTDDDGTGGPDIE